jgi:hypothetical protein
MLHIETLCGEQILRKLNIQYIHTPVDRKPEAAKEEVPKEDAVVKPVKGRKRRHRGKKQAAWHREEPKKLTRGDCGSRMKLAAACRKAKHASC